jgi:transcriptional regulator with XRE-family HTH domain
MDGDLFRRMLGGKIKALRTGKGITQMELARALGFTSTGAISQVESGQRGLTFESIVNAAKVLGVHAVFLMTPDYIELADFELVAAMLKLCAMRREQPELVDPAIEEMRTLLVKHGAMNGQGPGGGDRMTR